MEFAHRAPYRNREAKAGREKQKAEDTISAFGPGKRYRRHVTSVPAALPGLHTFVPGPQQTDVLEGRYRTPSKFVILTDLPANLLLIVIDDVSRRPFPLARPSEFLRSCTGGGDKPVAWNIFRDLDGGRYHARIASQVEYSTWPGADAGRVLQPNCDQAVRNTRERGLPYLKVECVQEMGMTFQGWDGPISSANCRRLPACRAP